MPTPVNLRSADNDTAVKITRNGELVIAPIYSNQAQEWSMTITGKAYNFAPPLADKKMVLQHILMSTNRLGGASDAIISIFTSDTEDGIVAVQNILTVELLENKHRDIMGLYLEIESGLFLNATTTAATVNMTMMGYYVDA